MYRPSEFLFAQLFARVRLSPDHCDHERTRTQFDRADTSTSELDQRNGLFVLPLVLMSYVKPKRYFVNVILNNMTHHKSRSKFRALEYFYMSTFEPIFIRNRYIRIL